MKKRNSKGFTLIELMAVIVVLGVLSAAAVPMYMGYRDDARRAEARGAMAAMVTAEQYYFQANGQFTDDWTIIRNRADIEEEILQNWNEPTIDFGFFGGPTGGFRISMTARTWVNRQGAPLSVQLWYDYTNGTKTWIDDTGMNQVETS